MTGDASQQGAAHKQAYFVASNARDEAAFGNASAPVRPAPGAQNEAQGVDALQAGRQRRLQLPRRRVPYPDRAVLAPMKQLRHSKNRQSRRGQTTLDIGTIGCR